MQWELSASNLATTLPIRGKGEKASCEKRVPEKHPPERVGLTVTYVLSFTCVSLVVVPKMTCSVTFQVSQKAYYSDPTVEPVELKPLTEHEKHGRKPIWELRIPGVVLGQMSLLLGLLRQREPFPPKQLLARTHHQPLLL